MTQHPEADKASAREIRETVGDLDDETILEILAIGPTCAELVAAQTWLTSDDYLHRALHHNLDGKAALVFQILESQLPEPREA